jgi:hypothetical protein
VTEADGRIIAKPVVRRRKRIHDAIDLAMDLDAKRPKRESRAPKYYGEAQISQKELRQIQKALEISKVENYNVNG